MEPYSLEQTLKIAPQAFLIEPGKPWRQSFLLVEDGEGPLDLPGKSIALSFGGNPIGGTENGRVAPLPHGVLVVGLSAEDTDEISADHTARAYELVADIEGRAEKIILCKIVFVKIVDGVR